LPFKGATFFTGNDDSMKKLFFLLLGMAMTCTGYAQAASFTDPAQAYNRLLIEKNSGAYTRVATFKVIGTPYLFGEKQTGSVFAKGQTGHHVLLSYNTYLQQLEIYMAGQDKPLVKKLDEVDSFRLEKSASSDYTEDMIFVNAIHAPSFERAFVQLVAKGERFTLYKMYASTLGYVSTNYVQSELRQFDLNYDYWYTDTKNPGLKKLKKSAAGIRKEFKNIKDISSIIDDTRFQVNPEIVLKDVFVSLNRL
jgi:hypothetical protein